MPDALSSFGPPRYPFFALVYAVGLAGVPQTALSRKSSIAVMIGVAGSDDF